MSEILERNLERLIAAAPRASGSHETRVSA